jgi:hypothetical protein
MSVNSPDVPDHKSRAVLLVSVLVSLFWIAGMTLNVYRFAAVGAVFEALWLPGIMLICLLGGWTFLYWKKDHFSLRSLHLYAWLLLIATILYTVFMK